MERLQETLKVVPRRPPFGTIGHSPPVVEEALKLAIGPEPLKIPVVLVRGASRLVSSPCSPPPSMLCPLHVPAWVESSSPLLSEHHLVRVLETLEILSDSDCDSHTGY